MIHNAVKVAVRDRLEVVQALAGRLAALLEADDAPGMVLCRLGVDVDHAASQLAEHCRHLESTREKQT